MRSSARIAALLAALAVLPATRSAAQAAPDAAVVVTVPVTARVETTPVLSAEDAADDPAIWRNRARPSASLIVGTDKKEGLNVYDLSGRLLSNLPAGRVNNVDLRDGVRFGRERGVLVAASDRTDRANGAIALFRLDTVHGTLAPLGSVSVGPGEAYGFCLWRRASDQALFAFVIMKDGAVMSARLTLDGGTVKGEVTRRAKLGTQAEGCVADDRTGRLYVAEEDVGIWRLDADPRAAAAPEVFARVDGARLVADAEGLALVKTGRRGGYLVASSQGDSAYAVWDLPSAAYRGRFRIVPDGAVDGTSDTDGIDIVTGSFGPGFKDGLMVAQDGDNAPDAQNFKLLPWSAVRTALRLN